MYYWRKKWSNVWSPSSMWARWCLFKDVSSYSAPVSCFDALKMLQSLKCYPLLTGYNREDKLDINALVQLIVKISNFSVEKKIILRKWILILSFYIKRVRGLP